MQEKKKEKNFYLPTVYCLKSKMGAIKCDKITKIVVTFIFRKRWNIVYSICYDVRMKHQCENIIETNERQKEKVK